MYVSDIFIYIITKQKLSIELGLLWSPWTQYHHLDIYWAKQPVESNRKKTQQHLYVVFLVLYIQFVVESQHNQTAICA